MKARQRKATRIAACILLATCGLSIAACVALAHHAPLSATEVACVGSWTYLSPDSSSPTRIVYHFGSDRSVREEHFYLTSAYPDVPRITMRGQWRVDADGRMTVEPSTGISYVSDLLSKTLGDHFDNGKEGWARPILRRFYKITSVTNRGIQATAAGSGGTQIELKMEPL